MTIISDQSRRLPGFITYGANLVTGPAATTFSPVAVTVGTPGAGVNPISGLSNAFRISTVIGAAGHYITTTGSQSTVAGGVYTYAWDLKSETTQFVQVLFDPSLNAGYANFDLINNTVTAFSGLTPSIIDLGLGWRRISVTFTAIGSVSIASDLYLMFVGLGNSARFASLNVIAGQETSVLACNLQVVPGNIANAF